MILVSLLQETEIQQVMTYCEGLEELSVNVSNIVATKVRSA